MFIGHYAVGLAAKRAAPRASLGWLIGAALLVDLLWPIFLLLGWERVRIDPGNTAFTPLAFDFYPFTHRLAATLGWAVLFGIVYLGAALGPPPPSVEALACVSIGGCLVPLWAAWLDRHRAVRCAGGGAWAT